MRNFLLLVVLVLLEKASGANAALTDAQLGLPYREALHSSEHPKAKKPYDDFDARLGLVYRHALAAAAQRPKPVREAIRGGDLEAAWGLSDPTDGAPVAALNVTNWKRLLPNLVGLVPIADRPSTLDVSSLTVSGLTARTQLKAVWEMIVGNLATLQRRDIAALTAQTAAIESDGIEISIKKRSVLNLLAALEIVDPISSVRSERLRAPNLLISGLAGDILNLSNFLNHLLARNALMDPHDASALLKLCAIAEMMAVSDPFVHNANTLAHLNRLNERVKAIGRLTVSPSLFRETDLTR